jgi:hypothetical protein
VARAPEGKDRPSQQEQVPERAGANEEDVQGRPYGMSTRAVETLPRRSVALRTTT